MAIYKRKNIWYSDCYCQGYRVRKMVGPSKRMAEQAWAVRTAEILQGRYRLNEKKKPIGFRELSDQYMEYAKTTKLSWQRDCDFVKRFNTFFKDRPLDHITTELVEKYKTHRRNEILNSGKYAGREPRDVPMATINRELSCLRRIFNLAIAWGKAEKNPVKGVRFFREEQPPEKILTDEEIRVLLLCCNRVTADVVQFALHTGMRRGEILGLRWDQVELPTGYITVTRTKSGKQRKIPMNGTVRDLLERQPRQGMIVFHRNGKPAKSVRTDFEKAVRRAAIGHCRFHDLRHTFATRLVLGRVSLPVVRDLMGHSTIVTTMRYAHPTPESKKNAVALLERVTASCEKRHAGAVSA